MRKIERILPGVINQVGQCVIAWINRPYCQGSNQNQPPKIESKPASPRVFIYSSLFGASKWFRDELSEQEARLRALARAFCGRRFV